MWSPARNGLRGGTSPLLISAATDMAHSKSAMKYARYSLPSGRLSPTCAYGRPTTAGTRNRTIRRGARSRRPSGAMASAGARRFAGTAAIVTITGATASAAALLTPAVHIASSTRLVAANPHAGPTSAADIQPPGADPNRRRAIMTPGSAAYTNTIASAAPAWSPATARMQTPRATISAAAAAAVNREPPGVSGRAAGE